jgi:hypothetical protein
MNNTPPMSSAFLSPADLPRLKAQGLKFGIDRMRLLAAAIGQPERAVPCVHVAGTNGKGSVSAMLDAIFEEAGLRRGLYTSPHLVRLGERVQVNRQILTEAEIMAYTRELRPIAAQLAATGGFEVQGDEVFIRVEHGKRHCRPTDHAAPAQMFATGRLDFDDTGPSHGQQKAAIRAVVNLTQIDHGDAIQRQRAAHLNAP